MLLALDIARPVALRCLVRLSSPTKRNGPPDTRLGPRLDHQPGAQREIRAPLERIPI